MMRFEISPVIAAVRSAEEYAAALESGAETVFVVKSDLLSLREMLAEKRGKQVFVHADTCEGLGKDKVGLEVLSRLGADGVISTKNSLIAAAKGLELGTVQRFFLIDSLSVQTAFESVSASRPDCAELMPGVLCKEIARFRARTQPFNVKIIAGGLIESKSDVIAALSAGADAVSVGRQELWYI